MLSPYTVAAAKLVLLVALLTTTAPETFARTMFAAVFAATVGAAPLTNAAEALAAVLPLTVELTVTPEPPFTVMLPEAASVEAVAEVVSVAVTLIAPVGAVLPPTLISAMARLPVAVAPVAVKVTVVPPSIVVALVMSERTAPLASVSVTVAAAVDAAVITSAPVELRIFSAVRPVQPDVFTVTAPAALMLAV